MAEFFRVGAINLRDTLTLPDTAGDLDGFEFRGRARHPSAVLRRPF